MHSVIKTGAGEKYKNQEASAMGLYYEIPYR